MLKIVTLTHFFIDRISTRNSPMTFPMVRIDFQIAWDLIRFAYILTKALIVSWAKQQSANLNSHDFLWYEKAIDFHKQLDKNVGMFSLHLYWKLWYLIIKIKAFTGLWLNILITKLYDIYLKLTKKTNIVRWDFHNLYSPFLIKSDDSCSTLGW